MSEQLPTNPKPESETLLETLREQIDAADRDLIEALAKRMAVIPKVAEYKKSHGLPRYQPEREKVVLANRVMQGLEKGISSDLMEGVMRQIIKDAHRIEEEIMGE